MIDSVVESGPAGRISCINGAKADANVSFAFYLARKSGGDDHGICGHFLRKGS